MAIILVSPENGCIGTIDEGNRYSTPEERGDRQQQRAERAELELEKKEAVQQQAISQFIKLGLRYRTDSIRFKFVC